mmetsp:Transcript_27376/g.45573  ORF Transcript_27376/g.45573 Transcript_27376/m.45573 type:complete len:222 (-) Transcript_27376:38-703(-)|eukprot:CAMPEP_0119006410 /NCGR_PEP_ID=MMETSP1176-20130426/2279_1 /TAXON_ID=265551 /ORGANISM="Synedropsis recta cf, Strain CCMP1620" /LENGTH=221 /DNA_ID=CAMNT_0006958319 /DNA_START=32 /DNA_END=697 /DNA_ORIENTATION=+
MASSSSNLTEEIKAIVSAALGGVRYGIKIRFPHAFVMTLLFRQDQSTSKKIATILRLSRDHAISLGAFAAIYKTVLALLKASSRAVRSFDSKTSTKASPLHLAGRILVAICGVTGRRLVERPPGYPERNHHALLAGAVGGYLVWGRYNKVNTQINLYLLSRVIIALGKRHGFHIEHNEGRYRWFGAAVWGIVMHLFEGQPDALHSSLERSMDEIYRYSLPL